MLENRKIMFIAFAPIFASPVRVCRAACAMLLLLTLAQLANAQATHSATGSGQSIWVGGSFLNMNPAFPNGTDVRMSGIGAFGEFDWTHRIAFEASMDFLRFNSYNGETQTAFLVGPKYIFLHSNKWRPYARFSIGSDRVHFPFELGDGSYFTLAPAGGVEYRFDRRWAVRAEYQQRFLLNSPNFSGEPQFGMHPGGFQFGVSYRIKHWQ